MRPQQPKPLTPEEKVQAQLRILGQKVEATAQGVLFNLANNPEALKKYSPEQMVEVSINMADAFVKGVGTKMQAIIGELTGDTPKEGEE